MPRHPLFILSFVIVCCLTVAAQPKAGNPPPAKLSTEKAAREAEAERLLKERRANAQSLLINLAADARSQVDARDIQQAYARMGSTISLDDLLRGVESLDGNTVDRASEMAKMAENQLLYDASAELLKRKLGMLKYSITEGGGNR